MTFYKRNDCTETKKSTFWFFVKNGKTMENKYCMDTNIILEKEEFL